MLRESCNVGKYLLWHNLFMHSNGPILSFNYNMATPIYPLLPVEVVLIILSLHSNMPTVGNTETQTRTPYKRYWSGSSGLLHQNYVSSQYFITPVYQNSNR